MNKTLRPALAELIGTFCFFFVGAGAICLDSTMGGKGYGLLGIALAHGLMLSVMVSAFGHISGAHFNPAVTIALAVTKKCPWANVLPYLVAQLVGGSAAGFALKHFFPSAVDTVHLGTPALAGDLDPLNGLLLEAILTFILMTTIFATAVDPRGAFNKIGGFGIGLAVFGDILVGGPLTGAAMNPARHFGTALAAGFWENAHIYWIGPLIGAIVAAVVYNGAFLSEQDGPE